MTKGKSKGQGTIYKDPKSGIYMFKIIINGKPKVGSLKTKDENQANVNAKLKQKEFAPVLSAQSEEDIAYFVGRARNILKQKKEIKLNELWDTYWNSPSRKAKDSTAVKHEYKLNRFIDWLKDNYPNIETVQKITFHETKEYASDLWRQNGGISAKTYNDHIEILRMIIRIVANIPDNLNPFNPQIIIKKEAIPETRKELTEKETLQILNSFDKDFYVYNKQELRILFNIACWTAQRLKDCCLLKWDSVNFKTNKINIIPSKTRKYKKVINIPIHPELNKWLNIAKEWRNNEFVLPVMAERYVRNPRGISKDMEKVFTFNKFITNKKVNDRQRKLRANIYGIHSFRHSFVSFCLNSGVPLAVVEAIIGDGSPVIKKHYSHVGDKTISAAFNYLPSFNNDKTLKRKVIELIDNASDKDLNKIKKFLEKKAVDLIP